MHKALVVTLLVLGCLAFVAAPAAAQRDPFQAPSDQTGSVEAPPDTAPQADPAEVAPPPTDPLANTGLETQSWLALAYGLIAAGAGAIAIGRLARPAPTK